MSRAFRKVWEGLSDFAVRMVLASILFGVALVFLIMYADYLIFEEG